MKSLSILVLLPALTFGFFFPFPVPSNKENIKIDIHEVCPLLQFIDSELCNVTTNRHVVTEHNNFNPKQLCPLIQFLNSTLCSEYDFKNGNKTEIKEINIVDKDKIDPKDLCPILELVDKTFCESSKIIEDKIDPKDLCPLLKLLDTKLCSS